jgi:hypothetical protein
MLQCGAQAAVGAHPGSDLSKLKIELRRKL